MRQVTHALLTRPPLSQITFPPERIKAKCFARLACVRHAASVHPEPGSNSHVFTFGFQSLFRMDSKPTAPPAGSLFQAFEFSRVQNFAWLILNRSTVVLGFHSECSHSWPYNQKAIFNKNFQGFTYCSVFKVLSFASLLFSAATLISYHVIFYLSITFFLFLNFLVTVRISSKVI